MNERPEPRKIRVTDLAAAFRTGIAVLRRAPGLSIGYSALFTVTGFILYAILEYNRLAPLSIALAGGFMLIGPGLLAGYFNLADTVEAGERVSTGAIIDGFRQAPPGLWGIALVCGLLFMIWITDAGTIYAFMVGQDPIGFRQILPPIEHVGRFLLFSSLMGLGLALIIFAISAFSVPLLYYRRTSIVPAVVASIRAVFRNLPAMLLWAALLVLLVMSAAWLLPLLPLTLPLCAFTSHALYRMMFPPPATG